MRNFASKTRFGPLSWAALAAAAGLAAWAPHAPAAESLAEALAGGKVSGQLRYRYEWVDQENFASEARASTLRTQLGYATGDWKGLGAFVQFEDVHVVGRERYNSTVNGLTQFPVVADPEDTELNQAYLQFKGVPDTTLKLGRQVITYDNHRFIGDVGWRQNQQTYDALTLVNSSLPDTTVSYAHVTNVNRIFSEKHPTLGDVEIKGDWLNVAYRGLPAGTLVGYGYFVDYEPGQPFPVTASHKTLGLRFDGSTKLAASQLLYTAEYAKQSDYKDGAATVDAQYGYGMLGLDIAGMQFKLNYELLSGDGVYALQTPFATLHAHNGWADKFLVTPVDGLEDVFLSAGGKAGPVNWTVAYHRFASDYLGYDYGTELDLLAAWTVKHLTLLVKYADYRGNENSTNVARNPALSQDVTKSWLQAEVKF